MSFLKEFYHDFKVIWFLIGFILLLGVSSYLYSLTPQAIESEKQHQAQLQIYTCKELYQKLVESIPHGYTVGGAHEVMGEYNKAIEAKGCIK